MFNSHKLIDTENTEKYWKMNWNYCLSVCVNERGVGGVVDVILWSHPTIFISSSEDLFRPV